ncbi:NAD(P)/FAD-dependent oxidoreductase [Kocuria flava]|uniref:NAD(P)/FAD-dependent oxidoreductase n=1 Tax=Kocuria flava TaxID=446860 RepID=UPI001FF58695|nr:NAD(P)/FAD-dependent oxidoreductase [Kocuria flava]MCJ8504832.1 NAD(P)/FAD-dependent oxidoreductase [Kocuria flava]
MTRQTRPETCDVVVVGGGAAGLSAAVALARSLRSVVVVDAGELRNAPAAGAHNVLGREGVAPLELLAAGRAEAEGYGARVRADRAVAVRRADDDGFAVELAGGAVLRARRLLLATGLVDELPELPGLRSYWGTGVLHCPYCHGWEVRGRRIVVLGSSPNSVHQALLFRQLSEDVVLVRHTMPDPGPEAAEQLAAAGIAVVEATAAGVRGADGVLRALVLADGTELAADAVVVAPRFAARTRLYEQLGGTPTDHPFGAYVAGDPTGRTEIPGVWVAGNAADLSAMVSVAGGAGVLAGAAINADLVREDVEAAVRARSAAPARTG